MKIFIRISLGLWIPVLAGMTAWARPLLTEPVETVGRFNFEAGTSLSYREDKFGPDNQKYLTTNFPLYAKFGFTETIDGGFELRSINQHYQHNSTDLGGALKGDFTSEIKISPSKHAGIEAKWRLAKSEDHTEELSITHGNDLDFNLLLAGPDGWLKSSLNVGYDFRGNYHSQFGVNEGTVHRVEPGNIFESKIAFEAPLRWNVQALLESAYYNFENEKSDDLIVEDSKGQALDLLVGLTWATGGWNLGGGVSFGMLDERHTSFDLTRGAGDITYTFSLAYKLKPHKPEK